LQSACIQVNNSLNSFEDDVEKRIYEKKIKNLEIQFESYCKMKLIQIEQEKKGMIKIFDKFGRA
jgi:hypothetical protein